MKPSLVPLACASIAALLAAGGCGPEPEPPPPEAAAPAPETAIAPAAGTVAAPDGVPIAYDVRGGGDTALVFVHCWACNRSFWRDQLDAFADGYRVVALDLPGHGASGDGREVWSIPGFGADVAAVVEELDLERVVLVGHSMGGPVSLAAAARLPGRVVGVVCADTLHDAEFVFPEEAMAQMIQGFETDFEGAMRRAVQGMFSAGNHPELAAWVTEQALETDPAVAVALFRGFPELDMPALFAGAGVPIRCINAAPTPQAGFPTAVETNREYADYDAVLMEGVGHYLQIERPVEFNARLRQILAELEGGGG